MKHFWLWLLIATAAILTGVAACNDISIGERDTDDDTVPDDDSAGDESDDDEADTGPTWHNFAQSFFASYCVRCHQDPPMGGAPMPLETYSQVLEHLPHIGEMTVDQGNMPPSAPLPSDGERAKLAEWIDAGAPQE